MEKQILNEVNRVREIMGLKDKRILTEQEEKIVNTDEFKNVIETFKVTPVEDREMVKNGIIKGLKEEGIEEGVIAVLSQQMDDIMDIE